MKKPILTLSISSVLITSVTLAFAAPKPPSLIEPPKSQSFAIKKPITFTWAKSNGASKYRLIIASDAKFTKYDLKTNKCAANSTKFCFSTTTQSGTFKLPETNPLLQSAGTFYWQVQAIGSSSSTVFQGNNLNNKNSGEHDRWFSVSEALAIPKIKTVASDPQSVIAGETITFQVDLTTELLDGYSAHIDYGDDQQIMEGSGTVFSYIATAENVGENQNFIVTIIDSNGEEVDSLADTFTVTTAGDFTPSVKQPADNTSTLKPVVVPSVSTINVSPSSVVQGNSLTFSANLSGDLPSGYSVKVDYGNGLFAMSGSGTNYSLNATPTNSAAYKIGVYDAKNVLKSNQKTGNFSVTASNSAPTLSLISGEVSAILGTPYVTQLQASGSNLSLIFIDWGDGASESKNATSGVTVSFSHTYNSANSYTWNATAYDSKEAASPVISKIITVAKAPVIGGTPSVTKNTGYTKIANNGSELSDDAQLGTAPSDWACTKDNKTGLIWEVKTNEDGLRDWKNKYSWYKPEGDNGGNVGYQNGNDHPEWCKDSECDTYAYTNAVNAQGLCGAKDWRMPSIGELKGLLTKKSMVNQPLNGKLYIDATYFPNTQYRFWSSSPYTHGSNHAWIVYFDYGNADDYLKYGSYHIRLVRGG